MGVRPYKDKKGSTRYRVTLYRDGRRLVDSRLPSGTTREQADAYDAKIRADWFNRERLGIQPPPLISEIAREYKTRIVPDLKSPRYFDDCIKAVGKYILGKTLADLHEVAQDVARALAHQAPATISHRLHFLKTLAKYAVKWRLAEKDYSAGLHVPKFNNARQFYVGKQDVAAILRHMGNPDMRRACWQLFYSGMRRGELWAATITADSYVLADTKNGLPRIVPIPLPLRRIAANPKHTRDSLSRAFVAACKASGYSHLRLHDLRHSAASMWLNSGADLGVVGAILGHKDSRSTKRYAHLQIDVARRWMNFAARGGKVVDSFGLPAGTQPERPKKKAA